MLLYLGIFSIVMFFAGLTSAFIVSQSSGFWVNIRPPAAFYTSTAFILFSSVTMNLAVGAVRKSQYQKVKNYLLFTFLLGIGFAISQYIGWGQMIEQGNYVVGNIGKVSGEYGVDHTYTYKGQELTRENGKFYLPDDRSRENPLNKELEASRNTASSYMYVLTVAHVLHLLGGLIYMGGVIIGALRRKYDASNHLNVSQCATYWHFLDGLWLYLLLFFLFIH